MFQLVRARPRLFLVLAAVLAMVLISATTVLAATWATGAAKPQKLKVVAADGNFGDNPTDWADIPGLALSMSIPRGQAIFLVTLSGGELCTDTASSGGWCSVRVQVNGQTLPPGEVQIDHAPPGSYSAGSHSMQFVTNPLPAGAYEFKAQWKTDAATTYIQFVGRTMSVLRAKL